MLAKQTGCEHQWPDQSQCQPVVAAEEKNP